MRRSLSIGGSSSVQWRKVGRSWRLRMYFRRLLCVRIEIDQLQCVNCWVIIHCLSVSCTKINHSPCALMILSSLQLTSKQWIITQQFTAGADLFLKWNGRSDYIYTVKHVLSGHSKNTPKVGFRNRLLLNAGQKYCRMLQGEHSAILSTFIKLTIVIKICVLSIFEWLLKTGFTVIQLKNTNVYAYFSISAPHVSMLPSTRVVNLGTTTKLC